MVETHERFIEGLVEARRQPGKQAEFHREENKQSYHVEEKNIPDRINHINIEFLNMIMPVAVVEVTEAGKPEPKNLENGSIFLDIIEMIFEAIGKMFKAILPKREVS